ncbi:hypothetical protein ABZS76_33220 [Streptomyces sp. NPDC005562]|uniref:hypothetical protein n=1 Tax=Streptomyces sp. NPDC005562 TaxID=3154890 RepID=UPI0033A214FA
MVQQFGLELLILADGWTSGEQQTERLRLALVASGADPKIVFSDQMPDDDDVDPAADEDVDFDYSAVDWAEGTSASEWGQLQEALASTRVTVEGSQEIAEPDSPDVPDVDFDREWQ